MLHVSIQKLPRHLRLGLACLLLAGTCTPLRAQTPRAGAFPSAVPAATMDDSDLLAEDMLVFNGPELPERGFNASTAFNTVYDQQLSWALFFQPAVSYRFDHIFSVDATIPIYFYRLAYKYRNGQPLHGPLTPHFGELGDTTIAGHAEFAPAWLDYTFTGAINAPTGDTTYGLSTGRVTYVVTNDFETTLRRLTPDLQLGIGDSSDLVNRNVLRNYDTLGTLAYFQGGGMYKVARRLDLASDLYEQLPLGNQKVYTQVQRRGKTVQVQQSNGNAEDNGVTVTLDVPPKQHWEFSSYFNRSFRLADSTVGFALTAFLKDH